jgi:uncharacterized membrane protein YdjX (TVP38/TMEM64 family)
MMALVLLRIVLTLGAVAFGVLGGLLYFLIDGDFSRAGGMILGCFIVAYFARPGREDLAAFGQFQQQRLDELKRRNGQR